MIAIISLLIIVTISIIITRIATIALVHTGLSLHTAQFQARSAFTGTGFTTSESERIIRHPVRRRIIVLLMLLGNIGIVTAVSSLILSFVGQDESDLLGLKIVLLITGLLCLWALASSRWVDRKLSKLIDMALKKYTHLDVRDYASVLHLTGEYQIGELYIGENHWLCNKTLADTNIRDEGIVVLGIRREDGTYIGAPKGDTRVCRDDSVFVYGLADAVEDLDRRPTTGKGEAEHIEAIERQKEVIAEEKKADSVVADK